MKCPKCNNDMTLEEREGVEIDVCPKCGGIYLDQGEIDEISGPLRASNREGPRTLEKEHPKSLEETVCLSSNVFIG